VSNGILDRILIAGIHPYFLEKGGLWFEENEQKILNARKTQRFFEENLAFIEKDQQYSLSEFLRKLDELGYERMLEIENMGEFSQRGGIVDVFPVNTEHAIRVEFLGNNIDSIEKLEIKVENQEKARELLKKKLKSQKVFSDLKGLKQGDYLVHLDHGVAQFTGMEQMRSGNYYTLAYGQGDKLFVPEGLERKLSRYVGFSNPKVSRLGSVLWQERLGISIPG